MKIQIDSSRYGNLRTSPYANILNKYKLSFETVLRYGKTFDYFFIHIDTLEDLLHISREVESLILDYDSEEEEYRVTIYDTWIE